MHRKSLSDTVADEIRSRIDQRAWTGSIPGIRTLASEFDVSPVTIDLAFKILEEEECIAPASQGKRRQILNPHGSPGRSKNDISGRHIGFLTSRDSIAACSSNERKLIERLENEFELKGACLQPCFDPRAFSLKQVGNHLKTFLDLNPMDFWIVTSPTQALAEALTRSGVPRLFIGAVRIEEDDISFVSPLPSNLPQLVGSLVEFGHKRIILPVPEIWHRNSDQPTWVETEFRRHLQELGLSASTFNTPRFGETPESLSECLTESFAHTPPSAVITTTLPEYLACVGFVQARSLRVPADISLATLDWQPECDWITPRPACFKRSHDLLASQISAHIDGAIRDQPGAAVKTIVTDAEFIPGESVAPRSRSEK